ncbi:MAG: NAD-dependent succinate-semialdehyde dehydrogenase [Silvibacterium sp.]|nr:NAD-dependent succinate-semialdehyde dehydrogenase [Silvibacterium sp.]
MQLDRSDLIVTRAWIANKRVQSSDARTFPVENPADGSLIAEVADCGSAEAKAAADAAHRAFASWRKILAKERAAHLQSWLTQVKKNQEDLARLISIEQGKPLTESRAEVAYGAAYIEWFAEEAKRAYGDIIPETAPGRKIIVTREPVGVAAAITPWNFPIAMLARKIAPALAAGCTIVAKPAEDTPLSALALALLAAEAGIPEGVVNVVPASRKNAGAVADVWLNDERVRKLSFTGSTAVGKHLAQASASTLKRLSLELGGNAPFIVFEDADLDRAIKGMIAAKFRNAGQTCICANRIYIADAIYDEFAERAVQAVANLRVGPAGGDAEIGPLINARALVKVERHVADAVEHGARVLIGGKRHALGRYFYEPTVLVDVDSSMVLSCEETFGPVAPLFRFHTEEEAISAANSTPFGLAAYFYSRDIARVMRVSAALESGMVGINEAAISTEVAPFGGVKDSGYGREGSPYGMDEYLQTKYLCLGGLS